MALIVTVRDERDRQSASPAVGERGEISDECAFAIAVTDDWQISGSAPA